MQYVFKQQLVNLSNVAVVEICSIFRVELFKMLSYAKLENIICLCVNKHYM